MISALQLNLRNDFKPLLLKVIKQSHHFLHYQLLVSTIVCTGTSIHANQCQINGVKISLEKKGRFITFFLTFNYY